MEKDKKEGERKKKVLASGCFDLLHSGHVKFFQSASQYGDLYVCIGTDKNIQLLKGRPPMFPEKERLYQVQAIRYVTHARLSSGTGKLDFEQDMAEIKPDYFYVCDDGSSEEKKNLCAKYGVQYIVEERVEESGLPQRSSTSIKKDLGRPQFNVPPYRICAAGGWVDQPWVSKIAPGYVVVFGILPTMEFNERAGLATSTRNLWKGTLWDTQLLINEPKELAKLLFGYENPPGSHYISGSQDHLGLTLPGINRLYYNGQYWPEKIDSITDKDICDWLENVLVLIDIGERPENYDPLLEQHLVKEDIALLGKSGNDAWEAILQRDIKKLGAALNLTHDMWKKILPLTVTEKVEKERLKYKQCSYGQLTSGCGGGYLMLVTDQVIPGSIRLKLRRSV